jgi:glycosyltransferase involved in cell wall biosynthesis
MLMKKRYGRKFIEKYYDRADRMVFQTEDAKAVYPENISKKGTVISNPIKAGLPQPYFGERSNCITTFCRISKQKNLPVMVEAFAKIHAEYPKYILRIIGDAPNAEDKQELEDIKRLINKLQINDFVKFEPFMSNVHEAIIKDSMYVSSSDYEGISNAMLEAMAIGMPVVCTDCPIGGAKATINDGVNGLLVPIKNPQELYKAIKRVIEEDGLADKLSHNAAKLREELSLDKTTDKWLAVLGE